MSDVDTPAWNFVQFMRRRAIRRLDERKQCIVMRNGRPLLVTPKEADAEKACFLEVTEHGNLTCHAALGPITTDGVQTYRTHFELNGTPISVLDAERIAAGLPIEVTS